MAEINEKNLVEPGTGEKKFSPENLEAYAQQNIEKYVAEQLKQLGDKFDEKIDKKETKTTEILAIFITLFTFISVNVQIFTKIQDIYTAVWFMSLMTISSLILLSFLFIVINTKNDWKKWLGLMVVLMFLCGLIILLMSPKWNPKINQSESPNVSDILKK